MCSGQRIVEKIGRRYASERAGMVIVRYFAKRLLFRTLRNGYRSVPSGMIIAHLTKWLSFGTLRDGIVSVRQYLYAECFGTLREQQQTSRNTPPSEN